MVAGEGAREVIGHAIHFTGRDGADLALLAWSHGRYFWIDCLDGSPQEVRLERATDWFARTGCERFVAHVATVTHPAGADVGTLDERRAYVAELRAAAESDGAILARAMAAPGPNE